MHDFETILKLITFHENECYTSYVIENNRLILTKSPLSVSSFIEVREVVQISTLVNEYNYSCCLLNNDNLEIIKE